MLSSNKNIEAPSAVGKNNGTGITLCRELYEAYAPLMLERLPKEVSSVMAVGLVGEGSECFGFDDAHSQDHDWGPAFCLWVPEAVLSAYQPAIEQVLAQLPDSFKGYATRMAPQQRNGRVGPFSLEHFYARFLRASKVPEGWREWRMIPEHHFATSTNGAVFLDALHEKEPNNPASFTAIRQGVLQYYPEDLRLKKLATRCALMAQAGQYNLLRTVKRGEVTTAYLCAARFAEEALACVHLLERRFMPFYKWATRSAQLSTFGTTVVSGVERLLAVPFAQGQTVHATVESLVEDVCVAIVKELHRQQLSDEKDGWLLAHASQIQARIETPELQRIPLMMD